MSDIKLSAGVEITSKTTSCPTFNQYLKQLQDDNKMTVTPEEFTVANQECEKDAACQKLIMLTAHRDSLWRVERCLQKIAWGLGDQSGNAAVVKDHLQAFDTVWITFETTYSKLTDPKNHIAELAYQYMKLLQGFAGKWRTALAELKTDASPSA